MAVSVSIIVLLRKRGSVFPCARDQASTTSWLLGFCSLPVPNLINAGRLNESTIGAPLARDKPFDTLVSASRRFEIAGLRNERDIGAPWALDQASGIVAAPMYEKLVRLDGRGIGACDQASDTSWLFELRSLVHLQNVGFVGERGPVLRATHRPTHNGSSIFFLFLSLPDDLNSVLGSEGGAPCVRATHRVR